MIQKNNIININKECIKIKKKIKYEIKKKIFKSIYHNKNINPIIRSNIIYKISKIPIKLSISKEINNICNITGRNKGNLKKFNLSRHSIRKLINNNNLQNIKINAW